MDSTDAMDATDCADKLAGEAGTRPRPSRAPVESGRRGFTWLGTLLGMRRDYDESDDAHVDDRDAHARHPWWLMWLVFLPFGAPMIVALLQSQPSPLRLALSLAGAALFLALYFWNAWESGHSLASPTPPPLPREGMLWLPLALMTALALVLVAADGPTWGGLFIFTTAAAAGRLPLVKALWAIAGLTLLIALGGLAVRMALGDIMQAVITAWVTAAATLTVVQSVRTNRTARNEREEMARLAAASAERLRIARDLHDLLGHSLSLIALKSELAGRLASVAPERAAAEIRDIEAVARTALQEVREAVAGYRQPTLAEELRGAREMLTAAGIAYSLDGGDAPDVRFSPAVEATLGWAVREGITNVIRHSRARNCHLRLRASADTVELVLRDDGRGGPVDQVTNGSGSGLPGLAERVAALGGRLDAGPDLHGGFRLAVSLPVWQGEGASAAQNERGRAR